MAFAAPLGYQVDDLDWLRAELGVAHLELDPWGSLIVSPATDEHEEAVAVLLGQGLRQAGLPDSCFRVNGCGWKVPGGSGYLNIPDLTVLAPGWRRIGETHLEPPPLLVVEVASPSTRGVDRGRKLADYALGGAGLYLRVDLPDAAAPGLPIFEAHDQATGRTITAIGSIDVLIGAEPVHFDLTGLAVPGPE